MDATIFASNYLIGCRDFCIQLFYWMLGLLDARTWKSARIPCYDKITVGVLFLNIKLKNYFLNKIFLWQSNLGKYLNFPHIFVFIQQVWFEILVKTHFLLKYKKRLFLRCSEWGQKQTLFSPVNEHFVYREKMKHMIF